MRALCLDHLYFISSGICCPPIIEFVFSTHIGKSQVCSFNWVIQYPLVAYILTFHNQLYLSDMLLTWTICISIKIHQDTCLEFHRARPVILTACYNVQVQPTLTATNVMVINYPESKVHGANIGPIWGRQDPGGPHVGPMKFATCRVNTPVADHALQPATPCTGHLVAWIKNVK